MMKISSEGAKTTVSFELNTVDLLKMSLSDLVINELASLNSTGETLPVSTFSTPKTKKVRLGFNNSHEIRRKHAAGVTIDTLAREYNSTPVTITSVIEGKTWVHRKGDKLQRQV